MLGYVRPSHTISHSLPRPQIPRPLPDPPDLSLPPPALATHRSGRTTDHKPNNLDPSESPILNRLPLRRQRRHSRSRILFRLLVLHRLLSPHLCALLCRARSPHIHILRKGTTRHQPILSWSRRILDRRVNERVGWIYSHMDIVLRIGERIRRQKEKRGWGFGV